MRTEDGKEKTEVLDVRLGGGVEEDDETGGADDGLAAEDLPSDAVFVGDPGHDQRHDDGEDVRWCGEELGLGVVESKTLLENNTLEVGQRVHGRCGDKVLRGVDDEFPVLDHAECLLKRRMNIHLLRLINSNSPSSNMAFTLRQPLGLFGKVGEEKQRSDSYEDGYCTLDDEDPAPAGLVFRSFAADAD